MNELELEKLLDHVEKKRFSKIEIKFNDTYIKLEREIYDGNKDNSEIACTIDLDENNDENIIIIKAPMVGTFHIRDEEDEKQLVNIGDAVVKGQTIGIIEAMKLMNEIESECNGEVVEIYAKDNSVVGYGDKLMKIRIK